MSAYTRLIREHLASVSFLILTVIELKYVNKGRSILIARRISTNSKGKFSDVSGLDGLGLTLSLAFTTHTLSYLHFSYCLVYLAWVHPNITIIPRPPRTILRPKIVRGTQARKNVICVEVNCVIDGGGRLRNALDLGDLHPT